jgi:hypothetical protein
MIRSYPMTPRRLAILMLRLIALFFLISAVTTIGYLVSRVGHDSTWRELIFGPYSVGLLFNLIMILALFAFPEPIARILARGLPRSSSHTRWTKTELLAVIIAGLSLYMILSGAPPLLNQIYDLVTYRARVAETGIPNLIRLDTLLTELFISVLRVGIALACFIYSSRLALWWENLQKRGLRRTIRLRSL